MQCLKIINPHIPIIFKSIKIPLNMHLPTPQYEQDVIQGQYF